uniref:Uncharacterized protein n=1 Tax=Arundo donax TaxID=35708 RepID=A0A0A9HRN4_ARUDO
MKRRYVHVCTYLSIGASNPEENQREEDGSFL